MQWHSEKRGRKPSCYRCGEKGQRKYKKFTCKQCHHLAKACSGHSGEQKRRQNRNILTKKICLYTTWEADDLSRIACVKVEICKKVKSMEVDTCVATSMQTYKKLLPHVTMYQPSVRLVTGTGEKIQIAWGQCTVRMKKNGPSLLGRDWLEKILLNWKDICINLVVRNTKKGVEEVLRNYEALFREVLGRMKHLTFSEGRCYSYVL